MKVFVTGGTGAIGGHALPALLTAGHEVTAMARTEKKAAALSADGATPAVVSIFDVEALTEALAGHDAVINLATAIPPTRKFMRASAWAANDRIRKEGSTAVVDAAISAGVDRVIQESVVMIYPDRGDGWVDESIEPDRFPIAEGNLAAEANTTRFTASGGIGTILRFGWFYGPGATHAEEALALARRHLITQIGAPDGYVSSIHMADAGAAVVAALTAPAGVFNVVDDQPLTKRAFGDALAAAVHKKPRLRVPGRAALLLGDRTTSLTRSVRASNTRFKAATGWTPQYPSAHEGWPATVHALG